MLEMNSQYHKVFMYQEVLDINLLHNNWLKTRVKRSDLWQTDQDLNDLHYVLSVILTLRGVNHCNISTHYVLVIVQT